MSKAIKIFLTLLFFLPLSFLSACAPTSVELDSAEHLILLQEDHEKLYADFKSEDNGNTPSAPLVLTLDNAFVLGREQNYDNQIAALEALASEDNIKLSELELLPQLNARTSFIGRNNEPASSSESIISGNQSLEPSVSTDRNRRTRELSFDWNLINAALALVDLKDKKQERLIAQERLKNVLLSTERSIYTTYGRALIFQQYQNIIPQILAEAEEQKRNFEISIEERLLSKERAYALLNDLDAKEKTLKDLHAQLAFADTELRSLLTLPHDLQFTLEDDERLIPKNAQRLLKKDIRKLETEALLKRSDMREQILQGNITSNRIREEIIRTIPGADIMLTYNEDSNSFLVNEDWTQYTFSITQNVLNLLTAPRRIEVAKNQVVLADTQRLALSTAVLAQLRIAKIRLDLAYKKYKASQYTLSNFSDFNEALFEQEKNGRSSGSQAFITKLAYVTEKIKADIALSELQDAYAVFLNSIGQGLFDDSASDLAATQNKLHEEKPS